MDVIINVDTERPVSSKHVCWACGEKTSDGYITLVEVLEERYVHPDSEGRACLPVVIQREVGQFHETSPVGSALVLLAANNKVISYAKSH